MYDRGVSDPTVRPPRSPRAETREVAELRLLRAQHPELATAIDLHLDLSELYRRVQSRVTVPWLDITADSLARHDAEGRPLLAFEAIPIEMTDLRLLVRQTADVMRRHGALEDADYQRVQAAGRDMGLLTLVSQWYRRTAERHVAAVAGAAPSAPDDDAIVDQVLTLAMRPFLARCAEVAQQRADLSRWTHGYCPVCGGDPDFSVVTPAAERHLICSRCALQWKFPSLTCPYCLNEDRARVTSFATPDGRYRVYGCDVCHRYLKAYDARRATRPVMPMVDSVATLPLDAAAMQRGYV